MGARAIVEGYDPYQIADWPAVADALGGWADTPVYGYPGWVAVTLVPFALMPLPAASAVWTFGGLLVAGLAMRLMVRTWIPDLPVVHTLAALTLFASQPARTATILGQWAFILVAALAMATVLVRRRPIAAGAASVVLLAKPQLMVLTYGGLLLHARARRSATRFAGALLIGGVALALVSLVALPGWPSSWLTMTLSHRLFDPPQTTTVAALLGSAIGASGPVATIVLALAVIVIAVLFRPGTAAGLGVWIALSVLVAPYQWSYDHLLLLPAIVLVTSEITARSRRRAIATAALACAVLLVLGTVLAADAAQRGTETLAAAVPLFALAVLVVGAWPLRQWTPGRVMSLRGPA